MAISARFSGRGHRARMLRSTPLTGVIVTPTPTPTPSTNTFSVDTNKVTRSGNVYTFTARRAGDLTRSETRTFIVSGDATSNPALASDFGSTFPTGSVTFPAGAATAPFTVTSLIAEAA